MAIVNLDRLVIEVMERSVREVIRASPFDPSLVVVDVGTPGHIDHDIVIRAFPEPMIDPEPDPSQNYLKLDKRRHRRGGKRK